ncbi:YafY family protein [Sphingosinicella sp. BN140058]|uniref:helix-turn-helix transcriptional regulator n=1 Tax=Sphingosinicella sp. BN140058 TaxID=1892855 RepID=UPI001011F29E|nr:WYL domain-containing protein [Sphingosinicella sp. BN140058]QAY77497.1 WYL domain-containing protein [Sphingosinicella sp. BN140058]
MRASRLLTILITLQLGGRVTARTLAEKLEVSKRTIYRDIDELSAAGIPVYADRGRDGGFALLDKFRTDITGLTAGESEALLLAGIPLVAADLGLGGAAHGARAKLLAGLSERERIEASRVSERFHLDPLDWYRRARPAPHLQQVAAAVWNERRLEIAYEGWRKTSIVIVDPLGLVLKGGQWYLVAAARAVPRTYRLSAIHTANSLDQPCERPPDFDLASYWTRAITRLENDLRREEARLRAAPSSLDRLERLGADIAEPLRAAEPDAAGWREAIVPIESVGYAAGLLLGFADEIEVLAPLALRNELAARAGRVQALYRSADLPES